MAHKTKNSPYRQLLAAITSKIDSKITVMLDSGYEDLTFEFDKEIDINQIDCTFKVLKGDNVRLFVECSEPPRVFKISTWDELDYQDGKIWKLNEDHGFVECDGDPEIVFYYETTGDKKFNVNDEIQCTLIDGNYYIDSVRYEQRCESMVLKSDLENIPQFNAPTENDNADVASLSKYSWPSNTSKYTHQSMQTNQSALESWLQSTIDLDESPQNYLNENHMPVAFQPVDELHEYEKDYYIPIGMYEFFKTVKPQSRSLSEKLNQMLPNVPLSMENYGHRFHNLLFLEEIEMKKAFSMYKGATSFLEQDQLFWMSCTNIQELRPPIAIGDEIHARNGSGSQYYYRGKVQKFTEKYFVIKFKDDFVNDFDNGIYDYEFHYNRTIFKRKQFSVDYTINKFDNQFMFPTELTVFEPQLNVHVQDDCQLMLNGTLIEHFMQRLNAEQLQAVKNALCGECRPLPFIIYGPPGNCFSFFVRISHFSLLFFINHQFTIRFLVFSSQN